MEISDLSNLHDHGMTPTRDINPTQNQSNFSSQVSAIQENNHTSSNQTQPNGIELNRRATSEDVPNEVFDLINMWKDVNTRLTDGKLMLLWNFVNKLVEQANDRTLQEGILNVMNDLSDKNPEADEPDQNNASRNNLALDEDTINFFTRNRIFSAKALQISIIYNDKFKSDREKFEEISGIRNSLSELNFRSGEVSDSDEVSNLDNSLYLYNETVREIGGVLRNIFGTQTSELDPSTNELTKALYEMYEQNPSLNELASSINASYDTDRPLNDLAIAFIEMLILANSKNLSTIEQAKNLCEKYEPNQSLHDFAIDFNEVVQSLHISSPVFIRFGDTLRIINEPNRSPNELAKAFEEMLRAVDEEMYSSNLSFSKKFQYILRSLHFHTETLPFFMAKTLYKTRNGLNPSLDELESTLSALEDIKWRLDPTTRETVDGFINEILTIMREPGRFPTDEGEMAASSILRESDSFSKTISETLNLLSAMRKIPTILNQPTSEATQHYQQLNDNHVDEQPTSDATQHYQQSNNNRVDEQPTSDATQHYQQSNNDHVDEQPIAHNNESLFSKAMRFGEELSRFVKRRINGIFEFVTKGIDGILALFQRF